MRGDVYRLRADQIGAVDCALRLGDMVWRLSADEMTEVDLALRLLLGLL